MNKNGWKYYNHAILPNCEPHEVPDVQEINDGSIWKKMGKNVYLARWTTDFDCGRETNWWYVIKDTPFDEAKLKAKRRYEINKGINNFEVLKIDARNYKERLYNIQVAAFSAYPKRYRPTVDKSSFFENIDEWNSFTVFGAFSRENNELCGYALLTKGNPKCVEFSVLKTDPIYEKYAINAALVEGVLKYYGAFLSEGGYICDGARNINHETAFQNYLEKYFCFRKAYCKLHIVYSPGVRWLIKILFPFRKIFLKADRVGIVHQLNSVLRMEEIRRASEGD